MTCVLQDRKITRNKQWICLSYGFLHLWVIQKGCVKHSDLTILWASVWVSFFNIPMYLCIYVISAPYVGLKLMTPRLRVAHSSDWASQAPQSGNFLVTKIHIFCFISLGTLNVPRLCLSCRLFVAALVGIVWIHFSFVVFKLGDF